MDVIAKYVHELAHIAERERALGDRVARAEAAHSNYNFRHYVEHVVSQLEFDAVNARQRASV